MLMTVLLLITSVSASLGVFKQYECINIVVPLNTSAVNLTNVITPSPSDIAVSNKPMTKSGSLFNYTFCNTSKLGTYTYGFCDLDNGECYSNSFDVNPTGQATNSIFNNAYLWIIGLIGLVCVFFGIYARVPWFGFIGGAMFLLLGVYTMIYGFNNFTDLYTRGIASAFLGVGIFFLFVSAYEWVYDDKEDENDEGDTQE